MISQYLIPVLQDNFPNRGLVVRTPPNPCAFFPEAHPEVGPIQIYDNGDEIILEAGNFTHGHFANYDENISTDDRQQQVAEAVISFLRDMFADRVIMWGSHAKGGGWRVVSKGDSEPVLLELMPSRGQRLYVWSGPFRGAAA